MQGGSIIWLCNGVSWAARRRFSLSRFGKTSSVGLKSQHTALHNFMRTAAPPSSLIISVRAFGSGGGRLNYLLNGVINFSPAAAAAGGGHHISHANPEVAVAVIAVAAAVAVGAASVAVSVAAVAAAVAVSVAAAVAIAAAAVAVAVSVAAAVAVSVAAVTAAAAVAAAAAHLKYEPDLVICLFLPPPLHLAPRAA